MSKKEFKEQCIKLRKNGLTLGEIVAFLKRPKTTIYYHIRNHPKSAHLINKLKEISRAKQKKIADSRRGKSVKKYVFKKPNVWTAKFIDLVAHFMFDGEIRYASCIYNNRSQVLIERVILKMKQIIGVDDYKILRKPDGVVRVSYHHVEIAKFIKTKAKKLLKYISSAPLNHKISFVKAFFDDEGSVDFRKNIRRIRGYQYDTNILLIIQKILRDFDISSKVDGRFHELVISEKKNIEKFANLINFSPGTCVNGQRSNSIWKKSLEKRHILQMALNSYQV